LTGSYGIGGHRIWAVFMSIFIVAPGRHAPKYSLPQYPDLPCRIMASLVRHDCFLRQFPRLFLLNDCISETLNLGRIALAEKGLSVCPQQFNALRRQLGEAICKPLAC
jgi:hypothetical protein